MDDVGESRPVGFSTDIVNWRLLEKGVRKEGS